MLRSVAAPDLSYHKYYAIQLGDRIGFELGRYVGMSDVGAAFALVPHLVRKDSAVQCVTVRKDAIFRSVFEVKGEAE